MFLQVSALQQAPSRQAVVRAPGLGPWWDWWDWGARPHEVALVCFQPKPRWAVYAGMHFSPLAQDSSLYSRFRLLSKVVVPNLIRLEPSSSHLCNIRRTLDKGSALCLRSSAGLKPCFGSWLVLFLFCFFYFSLCLSSLLLFLL